MGNSNEVILPLELVELELIVLTLFYVGQIACGFVAALLQYLFLSAFCWMMCVGIMLYRMFIKIFCQNFSKKWWLSFGILGYCEL